MTDVGVGTSRTSWPNLCTTGISLIDAVSQMSNRVPNDNEYLYPVERMISGMVFP